ncbi:F-box/kelch-repeat protein At3g06240-like [Rhodamnia argentea]|uniref:F-box/kelch-repeat protein At3g06240-like n=1 Tax=Rhodamnia argentea TaxID=178133 RepID=A0ABM3HQB8_9MYRT|nr:F-box/kelch-repeat protein At3g06240-like [Rhodamnia argentea]
MCDSIDLPQEILIHILAKLPVKSLVRFRCVSKSWDALVTDPSFVSLHLRHAMASHDHSVVLLRHYSLTERKERNTLYRDGESFLEHQELEFPLMTYDTYYLAGYCNGLLCFSDYIINHLQVILWNPSLRKCVRLPIPRFVDTDITHTYVLGFGFDSRRVDYKVVRLIYMLGRNWSVIVPPEVEVYELKTNAWRGIQAAVPYVIPESSSQAFVNGAIHWIGYNPDDKVASYPRSIVVLFDMNDEVFGEMELPKGGDYANRLNLSLAVHQDSICLLHCHPMEEDGHQLYGVCWVWVMKEYGASDSWSKLLTINIGEHGGIGRVLGFRKQGDVLLVTHNDELVSYDSRSQSISRLGLYGVARSFEVIPYMDCLVLL